MSDTMKALIIEKDLTRSVRNVPMPEINDCMALVKVKVCGICGTDRKLMKGELRDIPLELYPLAIGHEAVGEVVRIGKSVKKFKIGDIVSCPMNFDLGEGIYPMRGAMAEYATVYDYENWDVKKYGLPPKAGMIQKVLPDWLDPIDASMFDTLREPFGAMHEFGYDSDQSIVIYGAGNLGMAAVKYASLMGMKPIIVLDLVDEKLAEAMNNGADHIINSRDPGRIEKIRAICPDGVENVLDFVGLPSIYSEAMHYLINNGKICAFGIPHVHHADLNWEPCDSRFRLLFNSNITRECEAWAHNRLLALVRFGAVNPKDYIEAYYPFDHVLDVFNRFEKGEFKKKVLITF